MIKCCSNDTQVHQRIYFYNEVILPVLSAFTNKNYQQYQWGCFKSWKCTRGFYDLGIVCATLSHAYMMTVNKMFDIRMWNIKQLVCGMKLLMAYLCENLIMQTDHCSSASSSFLCPGGQQREIIVSKSDTKVLITDFNPSKDYTVTVTAVSGTAQSRPLHGRYKGIPLFSFFGCFCINFSIIISTLIYCI